MNWRRNTTTNSSVKRYFFEALQGFTRQIGFLIHLLALGCLLTPLLSSPCWRILIRDRHSNSTFVFFSVFLRCQNFMYDLLCLVRPQPLSWMLQFNMALFRSPSSFQRSHLTVENSRLSSRIIHSVHQSFCFRQLKIFYYASTIDERDVLFLHGDISLKTTKRHLFWLERQTKSKTLTTRFGNDHR